MKLVIKPDWMVDMGRKNEKYVSALPDNVQKELADYINASAEFYGIISEGKLAEIVNSQNDYKVSAEDIRFVYKQNKNAIFCEIEQGNIVHESICLYDDGLYGTILNLQDELPYKVLEKEEFLKTAKYNFFEMPGIYQKLRKHLVVELDIARNVAERICEDIYLGVNFDEDFDDVIEKFSRRHIYPTSEQYDKIAEIVSECLEKTPLWENRGYTYEELKQLGLISDEQA